MRGFLSGHITSELQLRVWSERLEMTATSEETKSSRQQMEVWRGHLGLSDNRQFQNPRGARVCVCVRRTRSGSSTRKFSVPADSRAELVQALCIAGGGVVKFWQVVYSLQNHLQHVADLLQHATWLHASQHLKGGRDKRWRMSPWSV